MTKKNSLFRKIAFLSTAVLASCFIFLSCSKSSQSDTGGGVVVNNKIARLMAFNLAPDKSAIGFASGPNYLTTSPLSFGSYTGNYFELYPGPRTIDAFDLTNSSTAIASVSATLDTNRFYSLFFVGAGSNYKNLLVRDAIDTLSGTAAKAYVRYVNAITDSLFAVKVTMTNGGTNFVDDSATFTTISDFKATDPGEITVAVKSNNGIDVSRKILLDIKRVYTVLLTDTTDPGSKAAIKYIINARVKDPAQ